MTNAATEIVRRCAHCGALVEACMGFVLARDQMRMIDGERIIPRELCGKCILRWSTRFVDGEIVDTTQEERDAFIDALPAPCILEPIHAEP